MGDRGDLSACLCGKRRSGSSWPQGRSHPSLAREPTCVHRKNLICVESLQNHLADDRTDMVLPCVSTLPFEPTLRKAPHGRTHTARFTDRSGANPPTRPHQEPSSTRRLTRYLCRYFVIAVSHRRATRWYARRVVTLPFRCMAVAASMGTSRPDRSYGQGEQVLGL